jgi:hypothetical protein
MRKCTRCLLFFLSTSVLFFCVSCTKTGIPNNVTGTWKLILTGDADQSQDHRIDTFNLKRTNDSVLQELLTFNKDDSTGTIELKGLARDSANTYFNADSVYSFSWIYLSNGPEIWITLYQNPKNSFRNWVDSTNNGNLHLHLNYHDATYFCDYHPLINGILIQEIFQKQN